LVPVRPLALLVLLLLAGCGGGAPSEVVPADATIYIGVDASQAEPLMPATSREDVDFERDVRPWLGERAAYFVLTDDEYGFVFDAEDEEAAEAFGRKMTAGGPQRASAIIDGRLVVASSRALLRAANAAADSGSLADSTRLDVEGEDSDDPPNVLIAAVEPRVVPRAFELVKVLDRPEIPDEALGNGPLTVRLWQARDHRRIEVAGLPRHSDTAPTLADVPGAAWLAVASADLGEDAALAREHEQYERIETLTGLDLERSMLPHLGAGMFFVQGRTPSDMGGRLVAEVSDEDALRREAIALARRMGPERAELHHEKPGADERFLELSVSHPDVSYFVEISGGRLSLDVGAAPGGVAEDLDDTRAYKDAARRLGGAPTFLMVEGEGYLAARDAAEDGRRVVRSVAVDR
jgi:hypothetical protein